MVPQDLKDFAIRRLDIWIKNAFRALVMKEKDEYIIQSKQGFDDVNIVIMDN